MGNAAHRRRMNEAHNCPTFLVRSTLGSTSGGAVSPNGLTEGVYSVEWLLTKSFESVGEARSLPLAGYTPPLQGAPTWRPVRRSRPFADGTEQNVEWGQLPAATPRLPPGVMSST